MLPKYSGKLAMPLFKLLIRVVVLGCAAARRGRRAELRWTATLGLCWLATTGNPLPAQYTNKDSFFTRGFGNQAVLRVDAELEMPPSMSMGVLHVTISTKTPSKADRDLVIVLYAKSWGRNNFENIAYRAPVRLAEGMKEVKLHIPYVNQGVNTQSVWDVGIFEGGRDIEDDRKRPRNASTYQWIYSDGAVNAMAALHSSQESEKVIAKQLKDLGESLFETPNPNSARSNMNTTTGVQVLSIADATADWRRFFPYTAWILSAPAIEEMVSQRPDLVAALRDYIGAGGILLIVGVDETARLPAVDRLLYGALDRRQVRQWSSVKSAKQQWWWLDADDAGLTGVRRQATGDGALAAGEPDTGVTGLGAAHDLAVLAETWLEMKLGAPLNAADEFGYLLGHEPEIAYHLWSGREEVMRTLSSERILSRDYLFGKVLMTSKPLDAVPLHLLRETNFASNRATGLVTSGSDSNWFWRNLIRAVGKPPVWIFCGMVTLFGALLGPGLLFFTGRIARRSLMIFLVPAISLITTLAIVFYGVVHEGFDTHLRITSVQKLEPGAEQGFVWSRQNYFSGLPPREGLYFDWDTYARPVHAEDEGNYPGSVDPRDGIDCQVILGERQNWRGWLKPRQQQQLLIGHAIQNPRPLIAIRPQSDESAEVENLTENDIPVIVFRGAGEDYYIVENLGSKSRAVASAGDVASVAARVSKAVVDYRPTAPPELQEGGSLLQFGSGRSRYATTPGFESDDILNANFRQYLSDRLELPAFGYALLTTESDTVEVPLTAKSSENLHLIIGVEPW